MAARIYTTDGPALKLISFANGSNGSITAQLYLPKDYHGDRKYPSIVIGDSMASVKEQMSGTYASQLALNGIIAMAIDYTNWGESSGIERQVENPLQKAADLSSAIWRQYPLYGCRRYSDGVEIRQQSGRQARELFHRTGEIEIIRAYSDTEAAASKNPSDSYYMDHSRGGGIREWRNSFSVMGWESWLAFDPVSKAPHVKTPTLMIHSERAAFPKQASKVYDLLAGPKESIWMDATHYDFYDDTQTVLQAVKHIAAFLHSTISVQ
ncbi:hypothetical protein CBER1_10947 [Cercospora berteroae]|uniref:Serine aminopeptidase S33 domain-containing protein n=1 Tax=Cercospora berteroae TaxID=357750 RepID=A0A2S6CNF6_9PEZI|nr:hypothetical protein CBER1_10947 [Cercospora berteroae]